MGEVWFYHLTETALERALPPLLSRAVGQGWRVEVRGTTRERAEWLDRALWLGADDSFLPHGLAGGPHDGLQPVLLSDRVIGGLACVMAVDGAVLDAAEVAGLARACILFDGHDAQALTAARAQWRDLTGAGLAAKYWAQDGGAWVMKQERRG